MKVKLTTRKRRKSRKSLATESVLVKLTAEAKSELKDWSDAYGVSMSDIFKEGAQLFIEDYESSHKPLPEAKRQSYRKAQREQERIEAAKALIAEAEAKAKSQAKKKSKRNAKTKAKEDTSFKQTDFFDNK